MSRAILTAAVLAAACITSLVSANAAERNFDKIGAWRIAAFDEKGRFHRCFAQNDSKSGMLRIAHFPNGNYNFSTPCFGKGDIDGDIPVLISGEAGKLRMNAMRTGNNCRTVSSELNQGWVETLKDEGEMVLAFGGQKAIWSLKGTKAAMASLKACVAQNR